MEKRQAQAAWQGENRDSISEKSQGVLRGAAAASASPAIKRLARVLQADPLHELQETARLAIEVFHLPAPQ